MSDQDTNLNTNLAIDQDLAYVGGYRTIDSNEADSVILRELTDTEIAENPFNQLRLSAAERVERAKLHVELTPEQHKWLDEVIEKDQVAHAQLDEKLKPAGFMLDLDPENFDPTNLAWYRCGSLIGSLLVTSDYPQTGYMKSQPGSRLQHGKRTMTVEKSVGGKFHKFSFPADVTFVDVAHFMTITEVTVAQGKTGGRRRLSLGSDYVVEDGQLVLLQQVGLHEDVDIQGLTWAIEWTMAKPVEPENFPFPITPGERGMKPLCDLCPSQFKCLAGHDGVFTPVEHEVVVRMNMGIDPLVVTRTPISLSKNSQ